jgi:hypothetical protein
MLVLGIGHPMMMPDQVGGLVPGTRDERHLFEGCRGGGASSSNGQRDNCASEDCADAGHHSQATSCAVDAASIEGRLVSPQLSALIARAAMHHGDGGPAVRMTRLDSGSVNRAECEDEQPGARDYRNGSNTNPCSAAQLIAPARLCPDF